MTALSKRLTMAAVGLAVGFAMIGLKAEAKELRLAHFMSPKHPMHGALMVPMAEALQATSDGKLTIKIYPAGALGKGPREQYNRAVDGIADITFGIAGYTSQQFPRTLLAELPGVASTTAAATEAMWRAYPGYLKDDFADVKLLALWTNDTTVLITRDKPVRTMADLKGLKIRAPSKLAAGLLEAWGAVPQTMPITKVYTAMQTGVIDGVFVGASAIRSFKLAEVGKYFTVGLPPTFTAFYLIMNRGVWDGLTEKEKAMIDKVSGGETSRKAAAAYGKAGESGLKVAADAGRGIVTLSKDAQEPFSKAAQQYVDSVVADRESKGVPAKAILATMKGN